MNEDTTDGSDIRLHPRDLLLRDSFTHGEMLLFGTVLFFGIFSAWLGNPDSLLLLGGLLIAGGLCPFILKTHEHTHPFFLHQPWIKYLLLTGPGWFLLFLFLIGLFQITTGRITVEKLPYSYLRDVKSFLPASTAPASAWLTLLAFIALHSLAAFVYMIPKTRTFTERLFPWLCLNAALVALFGILWKIAFRDPSGFAFYPHDGHWSAFAILWSFVCFAMAFLPMRRTTERPFIETNGPWYLFGASVLVASGFFVESPWPAALQFIAFSVAALLAAREFLFKTEDPHRQSLAAVLAVAAVATFAMGISRLSAIGGESAGTLRDASVSLVLERPLFGWGVHGLETILPFFVSDWSPAVLSHHHASGLLDLLASFGLVGLIPFGALIIMLLRRYYRGEHDFLFSNQLLGGCLAVLCLLFFDTPLKSPGLVFSLWVVFFTALRWTELSRTRADEVDTKPQLVTPSHKRRIPFYTGPVKERLR